MLRLEQKSIIILAGNSIEVPAGRWFVILSATQPIRLDSARDSDFTQAGAALPTRVAISGPMGPSGQPEEIGTIRISVPGGSPSTVLYITSNGPIADYRDATEIGISTTVNINGNPSVQGLAAAGAAPSGNPLLLGGDDGAAVRRVRTDTTGRLVNVGAAAAGAAPSGDPILNAGSDGAIVRALLTDAAGRQIAVGAAASGAALAGNPVLTGGSDGTSARTIAVDQQGAQAMRNATSSDQSTGRAVITTTGETVIVAQVASNRHRLVGLTIANRDTVATTVDIRTANAGTIIRTYIVPAGQTVDVEYAYPIHAAALATDITAQIRAATTTNGVEISAHSQRTLT